MLRNDDAPTLALDGTWTFRLGTSGAWSEIQVPSCWEAQGHSKWVDGPAEYRRAFAPPPGWAGSRILLEFDAVSYACTVNLNGHAVGAHHGMWTPFAFDVTDHVQFDGENHLSLVVYKPGEKYPVRSTLAGFLPDVATVFGGIWQPVRLRAVPCAIGDLRIAADGQGGTLHVSGQAISYCESQVSSLDVRVTLAGERVTTASYPAGEGGAFDLRLVVPDPVRWSPASPVLYDVTVELKGADRSLATAHERVGFRWLHAEGDRLQLNGAPLCVRGILHWGWDPEVIAPSFTDAAIREEFRKIRSLGFNLVKLCLFVPNRRYYAIADEEGMLLWQEWPLWLPEITPELRASMPAEYGDYMRLSAHHPSIVLYSVGCELPDNVDAGLLTQLDAAVRQAVSGALVCDNSGSSEAYGGADVELADFYDYHTYTDLHYFEPMLDHWRRDWRPARPWIFGEFNDTDGFRELDRIVADNGGVAPWWMTEDNPVHLWRPETRALLKQAELLRDAGLAFSAQELVEISRHQSLAVVKYVLEAVRRRAGMGGYVLIGIRDTPIATSGVLDDLGQPKWSPSAFRNFNDDAVLCLEVDRRRQWHAGGDRPDRIDPHNWWSGSHTSLHVVLNNAGQPLSPQAEMRWQLTDGGGDAIRAGTSTVPIRGTLGAPYKIGRIAFQLPEVHSATALRLHVWLADQERLIHNHWPVWVFPLPPAPPRSLAIHDPAAALAGWDHPWLAAQARWNGQDPATTRLVVATALDERLLQYVSAGGAILLLQQNIGPLPARQVPFWRESIKLLYPHPVWEQFPHQGYADLQFFGMATDIALETGQLHKVLPGMRRIQPILRRLDAREFHLLDHVVEVGIGAGRLLVSTLRHQGGAGAQPTGADRNVAGCSLLATLIAHLMDRSDSTDKEVPI